MDVLDIRDVSKVYQGIVPYEALKKIDLKVAKGEFVSIMGPSGSGKTTLLNIIATLDQPTSGEIRVNGQVTHRLNKEDVANFRRKELGFVFQSYNLLSTLTVEENIMLPLTLDQVPIPEMQARVTQVINDLGIDSIRKKRTYEISGGESQRVAIARAIIHEPSLILADEPTGNLDSKSAGIVMNLLEDFNRKQRVTTLMVTHDAISASYSHRVVFIKDGVLFNEIYMGESREEFYHKILAVLAHLGGTNHEFQATRFP